MSEHMPDALDARLAKLAREVQPARDLWPAIAAVLQEPVPHVSQTQRNAARFAAARLWQLAAVVLLMVASSAVTYMLTQRALQDQLLQARQDAVRQMQPVLVATPASFGYQRLGAEYARLHAELDARSARYLRSLPSAERIKVESSLADLRRAAGELSRRLAEHPSDPLLQELLLSTYQNEIGLLTRVNDLGAAAGLGADL
jgi:hypothetical protein